VNTSLTKDRSRRQWCVASSTAIRFSNQWFGMQEIRKQLVQYWESKWPLVPSTYKDGAELSENIRKSFVTGFFQNTAARLPNGHYESVQDKQVRLDLKVSKSFLTLLHG